MRDELLGDSTGVPGQRVRLAQAPVVADRPPLVLEVSEGAGGSDEDGVGWQEWQVVDHFAASGPDDRHVTLDAATGEIAFGPAVREPDGSLRQFGAVPAKGAALRATRYRTGGGRAANVASGAIQVLRSSIPYVARVENREAARGGVDGETVQEAKVRAPIAQRAQERASPRATTRSWRGARRPRRPASTAWPPTLRTRATTRYGSSSSRRPCRTAAAGSASNSWSRATNSSPASRTSSTTAARSAPGSRSGRPSTRRHVVATLHSFRAPQAERVRADALDALYAYLDPLTGGALGAGWPFGRPLRAGEIFAALQRVPGVELVDEVLLHPADPLTGRRGDATDRIELGPSALLFPFDHRVRVIEAR